MSRYSKTKTKTFDITSQYDDRAGNVSAYNTTLYKVVPETNSDIYVITQEGDRLDLLATQYYNDSHLWWFIARVNNLNTMNIPAGTSLRIPISTEHAAEKTI